jgi:hypothetical protein
MDFLGFVFHYCLRVKSKVRQPWGYSAAVGRQADRLRNLPAFLVSWKQSERKRGASAPKDMLENLSGSTCFPQMLLYYQSLPGRSCCRNWDSHPTLVDSSLVYGLCPRQYAEPCFVWQCRLVSEVTRERELTLVPS